jgi:hypothetical protein
LSHFELISALSDLGYINNKEKIVLLEINKIRNQFTHDITFFPSVAEIKILFKNAQSAFFEFYEGFSRGLNKLDGIELIDIYEIEIFIDFFMEIVYNIICLNNQVFDDLI